MDWIRQLQKAVDYIEEHLLEDINYEDAARWVHTSGYAFHRTFSLMAGMTANEYIRCRRLSLAARELREGGISVLDAALKYGYDTPESFSKAFSRFHGSTPRRAMSGDVRLKMFNPLVIKVIMEGGTAMDYRIVKQEKQRFIALVGAFPCAIINDDSDHSISDFWDECGRRGLIDPICALRPEGKRDIYGLCSPQKDEDENFRYGIGVIIDEETDTSRLEELLASGYEVWQTEPAEYAVFRCEGENCDCLNETWSRFFGEFLPGSGYRQTEQTDYEIYFERSPENIFCELWIPVEKE